MLLGTLAVVVTLAVASPAFLLVMRWRLAPYQALKVTISQLERGEPVERLTAHTGPRQARKLIESVNQISATTQAVVERHHSLLADIAHQQRTTLQLMEIRLARLTARQSPESAELHRLLRADMERLRSILSELRDASFSKTRNPPTEIHSGAVIRERVAAWVDAAMDGNLLLVPILATESVVMTRKGSLEQVLDILIDNAIKASPPHRRITVQVTEEDGTGVNIRVVDQGPGMTAEEREHATKRHWRSGCDRGEEYDGQGLGLSIAHMLVTSDGGKLTLLPAADGQGLEAHVWFPSVLLPTARTSQPEPDETGSLCSGR
jgi:signal transduction histidine kinase